VVQRRRKIEKERREKSSARCEEQGIGMTTDEKSRRKTSRSNRGKGRQGKIPNKREGFRGERAFQQRKKNQMKKHPKEGEKV